MLDAIAASDSDFTMTLGDMSYGATGQEQAWCDFVTSRVGAGYPFELLSGNHESNGLNGNINDFSACLPNQLPGAIGTYGRQYYLDVPAEDPIARFIEISPGLTFPDGNNLYDAGIGPLRVDGAGHRLGPGCGYPLGGGQHAQAVHHRWPVHLRVERRPCSTSC